MNWPVDMLIKSSVGKKLLMAVTGLCFIGFLAVHLAGNFTLYGGEKLFTAYAEHLQSFGPFVLIAEIGLILLALVHVTTGLTLFYQNYTARASRYQKTAWAGGRTIGSVTMPYTGILLLVFILTHLANFRFIGDTSASIYQVVTATFSNPFYLVFYVLMMVMVGLHISHGFWSLFQTLGANHPKYSPAINKLGILLSLLFGVGFGIIPIYFSVIL